MTAQHQSSANTTGWPQKNLHSYLLGYVLCLALTLLAFAIVKYDLFSSLILYILLAALAVTQMLVQAVAFLGLKSDTDGRWNVLPFIFTLLIILFLVGGSLWIMHNLSVLMMYA